MRMVSTTRYLVEVVRRRLHLRRPPSRYKHDIRRLGQLVQVAPKFWLEISIAI
jgi:hypothetical protein